MDRTHFSDQFRKMTIRHKRIGYVLNAMRQTACLKIYPITVDNFAALFNYTPVIGRQTLCWPRPKAIHFRWLGPELFRLLLGPSGFK